MNETHTGPLLPLDADIQELARLGVQLVSDPAFADRALRDPGEVGAGLAGEMLKSADPDILMTYLGAARAELPPEDVAPLAAAALFAGGVVLGLYASEVYHHHVHHDEHH